MFIMMIVYIIVTVVIAAVLAKRVRSSDSFLIAGRGLPWFLVVAVIAGDWIGGGSVIGSHREDTRSVSTDVSIISVCSSPLLLFPLPWQRDIEEPVPSPYRK